MKTTIGKFLTAFTFTTLIAGGCASRQETAMTTTTNTTQTKTATATATAQAPIKKGYVPANGLNYYYEIYGQGEPLLLLHGGLGTIEMFGQVLHKLAATRQVIAVELHGHGRTRLGDRKISIPDMGDDMAAIVEQLGYKQVDAMGYSLGAGVAFRLAVQHPEKVRRLALVSMGYSTDGFYPELKPLQAQVSSAALPYMKDTPMYKGYVAVAPDPNEFPKLLDRIGEAMRQEYNWADDVKKLKMPVILVVGDSDMFRLDHEIEFYKLLGGAQRDAGWQREHQSQNRLAVLPDVTHYDMFMAPALVPTVLPFLDGKKGAQSWAEQVDGK